MKEIISTPLNANNKGTRSPYWLILDPRQNMRCDIHELGGMITGPFFCRKDASDFLERTQYNFSDRAEVYCMSGCYSFKYGQLCCEIRERN